MDRWKSENQLLICLTEEETFLGVLGACIVDNVIKSCGFNDQLFENICLRVIRGIVNSMTISVQMQQMRARKPCK